MDCKVLKKPSISLYAMEIFIDLFLIVDHYKETKRAYLIFLNHPSGSIGSWFAKPVKEIAKDLSAISIEFK